jgi:hypothetical protein
VAVVVAAAVVAVVVGWRPLDATPVHTYTHNNREKMNFNKERKKRTTWLGGHGMQVASFFLSVR